MNVFISGIGHTIAGKFFDECAEVYLFSPKGDIA